MLTLHFKLLKNCLVTDSVTLPKHAFAPYTQQKTSIILFRKRKSPLPVVDSDIEGLIQSIKNEKINFFVVDNDGYANSDKRYPTNLKDSSGRWLHNDLADWVDNEGIKQRSKLFQALVHNQKISNFGAKEFGEYTGEKFQSLSFNDCYLADHHDLSLLADSFLRKNSDEIELNDYLQRIDELNIYLNGKSNSLAGLFSKEVEELTSLPIMQPKEVYHVTSCLKDLFYIKKGLPGLTEEIIYQNYDEQGVPVFGGGSKQTIYRIKRSTKNKKGSSIHVFKGPALVVSMDGSSGNVQVINEGEFTANHHAAVLTPYDISLDIDWVAQTIELGLKKLASNTEGSATLTKPRLEAYAVKIPIPKKNRSEIGDKRRYLLRIKTRFLDA